MARESLINALAERIETWKSLDPQIKPHAEKLSTVTVVADQLYKALEKAAYKLERLGVAKDMQRAKAKARALGIDSEHPPLAGQSPALDLYLTVWKAADGVRGWNRIYRRGRGKPVAFSTALTETLEEVCRQRAGLTQREFDDFLAGVGGVDGLPGLSSDGVKKRKERKQKKPTTK